MDAIHSAQKYFESGRSFLNPGHERYDVAIKQFARADELWAKAGSKERKRALAGWGETLRLLGRLPEAEEKFREAIGIDPELTYAVYGLGLALRRRADYEGAIKQFVKADALWAKAGSQDRKLALTSWGEALRMLGQWPQAEDKFRQAIEIDPEFAVARDGLGLVLQAKANYDAATEQFAKADALWAKAGSQDRKNVLANWGETLRLLARFADAEEKFRQALSIEPDFAVAVNGLGLALQGQAKHEAAAEQFARAEALFAKVASKDRKFALVNWGETLRLLGRLQDAEAKLRRALRIDPRHAAAICQLGLVLHGQARYQAAINQFAKADALWASANAKERRLSLADWGATLRILGRLPQAEEKFRQAIDIDPDFAYAVNGLGLALQGQAKYEEALERFARADALLAVASSGERKVALVNWAETLRLLARFDEAKEKFRQAIDIDPDFAYAVNGIGLVLQGEAQYDAAMEQFARADALWAKAVSTDRKLALANWAETLRLLRRWPEAERKFREAIEVDPNFADAAVGLGLALQEQANYEAAGEQFAKADALLSEAGSKDRKFALANWGETLRLQERYAEAEAKFKRALEIDPESSFCVNGLGLALQGQAKYDAALEQFAKAEALLAEAESEERKIALVNWAETLRLMARLDEANEKFRHAIEIDPGFADAVNGLGVVLLAEGKCEDAIEQFAAADALWARAGSMDRKLALANWGEALRLLGQLPGAEQEFREAIEIDADFAAARNGLGLALQGQGKHQAAIEQFEKADASWAKAGAGDRKLALANRGEVLRLLARYPEAEEKLRQAIEIDTGLTYAVNGLGLALQGQGKYCDALEQFEKADAQWAEAGSKDRVLSLRNWGRLLGELGDRDTAISKLTLAIEQDPADADSHFELGNGYADAGWHSKADEAYGRAIDVDGTKPYFHHNRADSLFYAGDYAKGWKEWERARKAYESAMARRAPDERLDIDCATGLAAILKDVFIDREGADRVYQKVLREQPANLTAWVGLASLYREWRECGRPPSQAQSGFAYAHAKAFGLLKSRVGRGDEWVNGIALADFCLDTGAYREAEKWLDYAEPYVGDSKIRQAQMAGRRGVLHACCERYERAVDCFEDALRSELANLGWNANLAESLLRLGRFDRAEGEFRKVLGIAPGNIEALIGSAQLCVELAEKGDVERYTQAEKHLSKAIQSGFYSSAGSKRLEGRELAQVYHLRGYVRARLYENQLAGLPTLMFAEQDLATSADFDPDSPNAELSLEKVRKRLRAMAVEKVSSWIGQWAILLLAVCAFALAQLDFYFSGGTVLGFDLWPASNLKESGYYALVTFGALAFMVAGTYLPRVLKLKVGAFELEKTTIDQISTPVSLGIAGLEKGTIDQMSKRASAQTARLQKSPTRRTLTPVGLEVAR